MTAKDIYDLDNISTSVDTTARVLAGTREDGTEVGFVICGPGSEAYKRADRMLQIRNVTTGIQQNRTATGPLSDEEIATRMVDQSDANRMVLLEHIVVDWFGFRKGGEDVPFSVEALRAVLAARPGWAKRLENAVEDQLNFVKG